MYYNKYRHIGSCLPHSNVINAIKILYRNFAKKISSHIVFAFNMFYSKNKTLQSQYPTHDTRVIKFRNLYQFEGSVIYLKRELLTIKIQSKFLYTPNNPETFSLHHRISLLPI